MRIKRFATAAKATLHLLKQVWVNLLSNAIKYTQKREAASGCEVGSREDKGEKIYFVSDNGTGFDMKYADKLFGVFQRLLHRADEFEGTGVGLAIAQRVVHRHGGRIWAQAAVDRGAEFLFHRRNRKGLMNENHVIEVLIVEDNPDDLELTLRALRKANLTNRISSRARWQGGARFHILRGNL